MVEKFIGKVVFYECQTGFFRVKFKGFSENRAVSPLDFPIFLIPRENLPSPQFCDTVFLMTTGTVEAGVDAAGALVTECVARAINRAALKAEPEYGLKAARDFV